MDCCRPCCRDQVLLVTSGGGKEVYSGHGDPNGVIAPANTAQDAVYNDLDSPGVGWVWDIANQKWV